MTNKLGVWYSNNIELHPAMLLSLETIKEAADNVADIITCPWNPIPNNPFEEVLSWTRHTSHINQILQIMQCILTAQRKKEYLYVSFLEHDVMYPKGYFDYPDFGYGCVLTNMNYGGINKDGWQKRNQNDQPMHQMTMHVNDAINHLNKILLNAIVVNDGNIENNILPRINWNCKNEAIHINHGKHFTSHFNIYDKMNPYSVHPYWGDYEKFEYLFTK